MPFTSPAHWVRKAGRTSCFYDPTQLLHVDAEACHGIDFVAGKIALDHWIERSLQTRGPKQTLSASASNVSTMSG